jgi:hypothetical protein
MLGFTKDVELAFPKEEDAAIADMDAEDAREDTVAAALIVTAQKLPVPR